MWIAIAIMRAASRMCVGQQTVLMTCSPNRCDAARSHSQGLLIRGYRTSVTPLAASTPSSFPTDPYPLLFLLPYLSTPASSAPADRWVVPPRVALTTSLQGSCRVRTAWSHSPTSS